MALPSRGAIERSLEAWLPAICAALALVLCLFFQSTIVEAFVQRKFSLPQLYSAVFGWSSIMTGFLFGVYGLIIGKSDGFISEIKHTAALNGFLKYTSRAVVLGFILTIVSIPFLISN